MTVAMKNKQPIIVPEAALRRAGFKHGQELEVEASGGIITIVPKRLSDERQDAEEVCDPKVRSLIQKGHEEFLAGKTRPIEELFAARESRRRASKRARRSTPA